jgi:hypothetical protein
VPLWKKLWLLFSVIWVVVAGLNILAIVAFSEGELEQGKALYPLLFAVLVPAVAYLLAWAWMRWRHPGK